jgi:Zn-dependent oligopeptidase
VNTRNKMAKLFGYSSYADLTLAGNRVASTPQQVLDFLDTLSLALKPKIEQELQLLRSKKFQMEGNIDIYAWDKSYYSKLCKSQLYVNIVIHINLTFIYRFDISSNYIPHYLSLDDCLFGLNNVIRNVFGIHFNEIPMDKVPLNKLL